MYFVEYPADQILESAKDMRRYLWSRQVPPESEKLNTRLQQILEELTSNLLPPKSNDDIGDENREKVST